MKSFATRRRGSWKTLWISFGVMLAPVASAGVAAACGLHLGGTGLETATYLILGSISLSGFLHFVSECWRFVAISRR